MCGLALVAAATLFPFDFSFDEHISISNRFKLSRTIESRGNDLMIGADAAFDQPLRGKIDELRIYRIALTPLQIAQEAKILPGMGSVERPMEGLVACYSFNETSGAVLRDDSGNGNDGKLANGPRWSAEGRRGALVFNGSGQYVRVPNSPSIDIGGQSLTILMRIALQDSRSDGVIVGKPWHRGAMQYPYYQYGVEFDGNDAKSVDLYLGDTSGRGRGPFSVKPPLGAWTHVAFVYDGVVRGYVDGREQLVAGLGDPWDLGDIVGNLLLFIPLGFGLAIMAQSKGLPPKKAVPLVLLLGAVVSLGVEILQCWLPVRDPSLIDIAANSTSSIFGAVLYLVAGRQHLAHFDRFLG
jgi:VanZ family protein